MTLSAGKLNRRITIQQQRSGTDASGQPLDQWNDVWPCWAAIEASTSKTQQKFSSAGFVAQLTHVVSIRYPRSITIRSKMRVSYRGRVFDIQYVEDPNEGREELTLYCQELDEGQP